jgi:hypothetical protein
MVLLFPFLFPPPLRVRCAGRAVPERAARRYEADLFGRHDVAVEHIQQLPEPFLRPQVAHLHDVDLDPHVPPDERGMRGDKKRVDVDSLGWIDGPFRSVGLAVLQYLDMCGHATMLVGSCFNQSSFTRTPVRASAPLSTGVLCVDGTHRHIDDVLRGIVISIRYRAAILAHEHPIR